MRQYLIVRLLEVIPTLLVVSVVLYLLLALAPGDPIDAMIAGNPHLRPEDVVQLKRLYGLDQPIHVQYLKWLARVVQGDLGWSLMHKMAVVDIIRIRAPNSILLMTTGLALAVLVAVPVGVYAAVRQYSAADYVASAVAFAGFSIPLFWFGLLMIYVFGIWLGWLPAGGFRTVGIDAPLPAAIDRLRHLILPALVIAFFNMAAIMRYTRSSVLEVIHQDYIRTARAKGLDDRQVLRHHAIRNAMIPVVTVLALTFPLLFGGAPVTESIFSWPGMGDLLVGAVLAGDLVVAQTVLLILATAVVLFNLLADVAYGFLDPRIQYR